MTIEQIMEMLDVVYLPVTRDELRAALTALVAQARNEEAEACIELVEPWITYEQRQFSNGGPTTAIRARIAARKVAP